jgi:hypothetical protein
MKNLGIGLILAPILAIGLHWSHEFLAVDRCLDSGGVYDYNKGECRHDIEHLPNIGYHKQHKGLLFAAAAVMSAGAAALVLKKQRT